MYRANPADQFWDHLLAPYRERDWARCLKELRPVLDADEDALVPRMLSAALLRASHQPALALLQYESLLPLAVGQGDFLRAFAVQKHLDQLHPASVSHAKRYDALVRWFAALRPRAAVPPLKRPEDVTLEALVALEPAQFRPMAEAAQLEGLDPEPRVLEGESGSVRLVLYGRARWSLAGEDGATLLEGVAEPGAAIAVGHDLPPEARLTLHAELPTELLVIPAEAVAVLTGRMAAPTPAPIVAEAPPVEIVVPPAARVPRPAPPRPDRPVPDPRFEPTIAVSAPVERRRETRIAVNVSSGIARLGLADTRVAAIDGRMLNLSPSYIELAFPRFDLHHLRARLERSYVSLRLTLDARESVACLGRVRWTSTLGPADGPGGELCIELEFMPMAPHDQLLVERAVSGAGSTAARPAA